MDPRPQSFEHHDPWNPIGPSTRDPEEQAVRVVQAVDQALNDEVGLGSSRNSSADSSPRGYGPNEALTHGLAFHYSKLDEPALCSEQSIGPCLTRSEYDYEYQATSAVNATFGSECGIPGDSRPHRSQSPRSKFRHHPYQKGISKSYIVYNQASHIYPPSELDTEETWSTFSGCNDYFTDTYHPENVYGSGSINPQELTVSNSQSVQNYYSGYSPTNVALSLSPHATAPAYYVEGWPYSSPVHEGSVLATGNTSDVDNEAVVALNAGGDLKKDDLKRHSSRKGKKRGAKGSIKGVQKSGEGKADKSVRGRKPKDRHMCGYSSCTKIFSNASELRKHMQVKHLRPFKCTFSFAGCDQIFGSKNEWKRHVTSQHMYLSYWECNLSLCKDRQAFFNRKDLFGQHLKRMHVPHPKKVESFWPEAQKKMVHEQNRVERERWIREEIPNIQDSCFKILRETPLKSNCEICKSEFSGAKSWDTKMEHVGKHYENGDQPPPSGPFQDEGLVIWALEHQLVMERDPYESSSNTSESGYVDAFPELSSSTHKVLMENNCKYQFTKSNQFIPRSTCSGQSPIQKPDNLPVSNNDLALQADNIVYPTENILLDGAFKDCAPGDHDTFLLLSGGRIIS